MNKNQEHGAKRTTFHTWARVAKDQMRRTGETVARSRELQKESVAQIRNLAAYNMRLASEWQAFVSENSRKFADQFFGAK